MFEKTQISGLFCFENKKEVFEGVHRSFKFVVLSFEKGGETQSFPAAFMRHEVKELLDFPKYGAFQIAVDFVKKQSPDAFAISEIKGQIDFEIAQNFLQHPNLGEQIENTWNIELYTEFHPTNDSYLYHTKQEQNYLPLFDGKMMHQFVSNYALPRYWINEQEGRKALLGAKIKADDGRILEYQKYRIAFRGIAASTNERTMIAAILPKNVFGGRLLFVKSLQADTMLYITAIFNSFCYDYLLRQTVTTDITLYRIYQTNVPRLQSGDKYYWDLVSRAARLVCCSPAGEVYAEYADLWAEVSPTPNPSPQGGESVSPPCGRCDVSQGWVGLLRAEIDAIVAKIYGLTEAELAYILSTFPLVAAEQKALVLEEFRKLG